MKRTQLGSRLCQWHDSMHDPIYAVGSFYVDNNKYPDKTIVEKAIAGLRDTLDKSQRMLAGEPIAAQVKINEYTSDLRTFAGLTDKKLRADIKDLTIIIRELEKFYRKDY